MPHHKSAKKRVRQTEVRTARNTSKVSSTRTAVKKIRLAITEKNKELASSLLPQVQSLMANLAKHGIVKGNHASRKCSRLAQQVNKL